MPLTVEEIQKKLETLSLPLLEKAGVELVELQVKQHRSSVDIEFMADLPEGGINIEQCAELNRAIVEALDADGFLGEDYTLEFSSPGLDRPLKTAKDFGRYIGAEIKFYLTQRVEGKMEHTGVLLEIKPGGLTVALKKKNTIELPFDNIEKGLLVI